MSDTFKILSSGKTFASAVKILKSAGGVFDSATKTWTTPADALGAGICRDFGIRKTTADSLSLSERMDREDSDL